MLVGYPILPHRPVRAYCPHSTRILPEYRQNSAPVKIKSRLKTVFQAFRRPLRPYCKRAASAARYAPASSAGL
ncbi:hypothetical protein NEIELOOT_00224 [Neisseria elongata subsp. glycolytica ATCC 29315]|uniref:Uncharacterized protein n=1 Tax=Neisseria elongata subsp. glycolytica ATCC 29315 TaxID=546263 RepID=D4DMF6_NEIEG|nr:hypothetical protein NEIELOOT_00224 [Neisseria elongata subsp. glycolytica ATCC 29315]